MNGENGKTESSPKVTQEIFDSDEDKDKDDTEKELELLQIQKRKKKLEIELLEMEIKEKKIKRSSSQKGRENAKSEINFYTTKKQVNDMSDDSGSFEYFTKDQLSEKREDSPLIQKSTVQNEDKDEEEQKIQIPDPGMRISAIEMTPYKVGEVTFETRNPIGEQSFVSRQETDVQIDSSSLYHVNTDIQPSQEKLIHQLEDEPAGMAESLQIPEKQLEQPVIKKNTARKSVKSKKSKKTPIISQMSQLTSSQPYLQPMDSKGRVPPPPKPKFFLDLDPAKNPGGILSNTNEEDDDKKGFFWEPISYKKLTKVISTVHPVDPETKQRFNYKDRVTIKDYISKITDLCFCYWIGQRVKEARKFFRHKFKGKNNKNFIRPESMMNEPDSGSCDSSESDSQVVSDCSQALGDGATLYLQTMMTFIIMFAVLVVLNIPLYVLYENNTSGNNLSSLDTFFKYFSIGNLGQMTKKCGWSEFDFKFEKMATSHIDQAIGVDCGAGYIGELQQFGFLYTIDKLYGGQSNGKATCEHIEDPLAPYKIPPPIVYNCDPEVIEDETELAICEINKALQDKQMTQAEAEIELEKLQSKRMLSEDDPYLQVWDYQSVPSPQEFDTDQAIGNAINTDPICSYDPKKKKQGRLFKNKDAMDMFDDYFVNQCFYKNMCTFDFKQIGYKLGDVDSEGRTVDENGIGLFGLISDECKLRIGHPDFLNITSPLYIGVMGCKYDDVRMAFSDKRLHKEKIGVITVALDFASILVMIFFFSKIQDINNEFLDNIDDLRVQMKDFGVKLNKVRLDKFTFDSRVIKLKVWHYFTEILKNDADKYNDMKCIDVCLSLYTQPNIQCVFRMQEIQLEINKINNKLTSNQYKNDEIPDKQDELKVLLEKQKRFEVRYKELCVKPKNKKQKYLMVHRVPKNLRIKQIQYIFVVFKNCETSKVLLEKFKKEGVALKCIKKCLPMEKVQTEQKLLFGKPVDLESILEPDEIIWENLAYTGAQQKARRYAINVFSVFFLIFNTLFTMYLSGFSFFMNKNIPDAIGCPDVQITRREAYLDYIKSLDDDKSTESQGLMGCYCKEETSMWLPWTLVNNNFAEFSELNEFVAGEDRRNYCLRWWLLQWTKEITLFFVSTSAVFINEIVANVFQRLGQFQKMHTKVEEQITCFRQIFIQEFINMGVIVLITSFDRLGIRDKLLGKLSASTTVYNGFEPNWYMDQGNKVCIMIFMSSFLVNSKDSATALSAFLLRLRDRKFKLNVKLDPDDESCDLPNTKKRVQSDLESLYTGNVFKGEKAFSRMMSTMFVIQMYTGGMPILYLIGFIFYTVTYMVNKFLLIYYYQKSRTLTKHIPIFTVRLLKYGLLLHLISSCFMLTNPGAFHTKDRSDGMGELKNLDQQLASVGLSESSKNQSLAQIVQERTLYYHQQLFVVILVVLILTYFLGLSFYTMLYYIAMFIVNLIKKQTQKFLKKVKDQAKILTVKQFRDKVKMQKALRAGLSKQVQDKMRENIEMRQQQSEQFERALGELPRGEDATQQRNNLIVNQLQNLKDQQQQRNSQLRLHDVDGDGIIDSEELAQMEEKKLAELEARNELSKKRQARPDYSDNIYQEFSTENLSNFYERSKRELHDFWDMFQYDQEIGDELLSPESTSAYRTLFLETLYAYRITVDECLQYQDFLMQRLSDLEKTIDKYFDMIQPILVQKMREKFDRDRLRRKKEGKEGTLKDQVQLRRYEEWYVKHSDDAQFNNKQYYPYVRKTKLLVEFQDELIQADKGRKENRNGVQNVCRMTGSLSQSYFIFDAQQFKVGRKIYYSIDPSPEEAPDSSNSEEKEENLHDAGQKHSIQDLSQNSDFMNVINEDSSEESKSQRK